MTDLLESPWSWLDNVWLRGTSTRTSRLKFGSIETELHGSQEVLLDAGATSYWHIQPLHAQHNETMLNLGQSQMCWLSMTVQMSTYNTSGSEFAAVPVVRYYQYDIGCWHRLGNTDHYTRKLLSLVKAPSNFKLKQKIAASLAKLRRLPNRRKVLHITQRYLSMLCGRVRSDWVKIAI